jgi:hypothetical protein
MPLMHLKIVVFFSAKFPGILLTAHNSANASGAMALSVASQGVKAAFALNRACRRKSYKQPAAHGRTVWLFPERWKAQTVNCVGSSRAFSLVAP